LPVPGNVPEFNKIRTCYGKFIEKILLRTKIPADKYYARRTKL